MKVATDIFLKFKHTVNILNDCVLTGKHPKCIIINYINISLKGNVQCAWVVAKTSQTHFPVLRKTDVGHESETLPFVYNVPTFGEKITTNSQVSHGKVHCVRVLYNRGQLHLYRP